MSNKRLSAKNNRHEMAEAAHRAFHAPFYWLRLIAILPIRFYRLCVSPMLPRACRYQPSCSVYAMEAIMRHGLFKGFWLSCWRILRCNPWVEGGSDPVPPKILRG